MHRDGLSAEHHLDARPYGLGPIGPDRRAAHGHLDHRLLDRGDVAGQHIAEPDRLGYLLVARQAEYLVDVAYLAHRSRQHHRRPVAQTGDNLAIVRDDHRTAVLERGRDRLDDGVAMAHIDGSQRLIQQHQRSGPGERAGKREALALAAAEGGGRGLKMPIDAKSLGQVLGSLHFGRGQPQTQVARGRAAEHVGTLRLIGNGRLLTRYSQRFGQQSQHRALAGTVGTEHHEALALPQLHRPETHAEVPPAGKGHLGQGAVRHGPAPSVAAR